MAKRRPRRLKRLRITEGSLVDVPANEGAKVMLFKSADGVPLDSAVTLLKGEITRIVNEEAGDPEPLIGEAVDRFVGALEVVEVEEPVAVQAGAEIAEERVMDETARMLAFSKAGGGPHRWSAAEIHAAMLAKAREVAPDVSPEQALAKAWNHPDVAALYRLHKVAEAEVEPEPVAKTVVSPAWAALLRATEPHLSVPAAIAKVMDQSPQLYAAYRAEQDAQG